jgi:hypothetical protein
LRGLVLSDHAMIVDLYGREDCQQEQKHSGRNDRSLAEWRGNAEAGSE